MTDSFSFQVPKIDEEHILAALAENFGIQGQLKRQNSYDDCTYHVTYVEYLATNNFVSRNWPNGFIFKITNPSDSENKDLIDGQVSFLLHLRKRGIKVPEPLPNTEGTYWKYATFVYTDVDNNKREISLVVRLFSYLPGYLLTSVPECIDPELLYDLGNLAARVHIASNDFHHPSFDTHRHLWCLSQAQRALEFASVFPDEGKRTMAIHAIQQFGQTVLQSKKELRKGQVHGDLNEHNILVQPCSTRKSGYEISALIDLWDTQRSCLIYDLALGIVYLMMEKHSLDIWDVGGHILAGYSASLAIPKDELVVLRVCLAARVAQSLLIGYYTYQKNPVPENEYVLFTQEKGWSMLQEILSKSDEWAIDKWRRIMQLYQS